MKKIILIVFFLLVATAVCTYVFIPSTIKITKSIVVNASLKSTSRNIFSYEGWTNWIEDKTKAPSINVKNIVYKDFKKLTESDGVITIQNGVNSIYSSIISLYKLQSDSTIINWLVELPKTNNPIKKIEYYQQSRKISASLDAVIDQLKIYIENKKLVYGFETRVTTLLDSCMIATQGETLQYPSVTDIYVKIEKLERYATANNAIVTNFPMLNIQKVSENSYRFMVALPINKRLENSGDISYKQMLPNGNFLCSDSLYGGFSKLHNLFIQFENYRKDLNLLSPAIPFQSLITDRRREGDTAKWITKFYYPIF